MKQSDWYILAQHGVTPNNLTVGGGLDLYRAAITALPERLTVGGDLDLRGTAITALPENLTVDGDLYVYGTAITALPDNLKVRGFLYVYGTKIKALHICNRGYRLVRVGDIYLCGCRKFTAAEAIAHWGSPDYPDAKRGAGFVAAVNAEEKERT